MYDDDDKSVGRVYPSALAEQPSHDSFGARHRTRARCTSSTPDRARPKHVEPCTWYKISGRSGQVEPRANISRLLQPAG